MQASRHLFNLFHGMPNAKNWRSFLAEQLQKHPFEPSLVYENLERKKESEKITF